MTFHQIPTLSAEYLYSVNLHFHNEKKKIAQCKMPHIHTHAYANASTSQPSKKKIKKDGERRTLSSPQTSKMFLPKPKPHLPPRRLPRRPLNIPRRRIRPAEINPHIRLQTPLQPTNIRTIHDPIPHGAEQSPEIGTPEIRARAEFGEGVEGGADAVEVDVCGGVEVHFLGQVRVDSQEFRARAGMSGGGLGLVF